MTKPNAIKDMFLDWREVADDTEAVKTADGAASDYLDEKLSKEDSVNASDLVTNAVFEYEKQAFEAGFMYAMDVVFKAYKEGKEDE